jgi:hypothetical protein
MARSLPGVAVLISSVSERNLIPRLRKFSIRCRAPRTIWQSGALHSGVRLARVVVVDLSDEEFEDALRAFGVGVKSGREPQRGSDCVRCQ